MKSIVRACDGDTDFVRTVSGFLQGDKFGPLIFIICECQ